MAGIFGKFRKKIKARFILIAANKARGPLSFITGIFLYIISLAYKLLLCLRFYFYRFKIVRIKDQSLKVISVGNITVGGTGKTPLVETIVDILLKHKKRIAIISRGYRGVNFEGGFIADEPQMLKNIYPEVAVIVNKNRIEALETAAKEHKCDFAVLDDALGNLRVKKDLEIVCVSGLNPFGFGNLLPRGLLRLPLCYLKNTDIFVLTHAKSPGVDLKGITERLRRYNKKALILKSEHTPQFFYRLKDKVTRDLDFFQGEKVALVCGIAQPDIFEKSVKDLGCKISLKFFFEDHHVYTNDDFKEILKECRQNNISYILTTAKDESRINLLYDLDSSGIEIFILKIKLKVDDNEGRFLGRISSLFADRPD